MKKLKAFTLVELLVVVAIIAILATIVVVNYSGIQSRAKKSATVETLNNLGTAVMVCNVGSTLVTPSAGGDICTDATLTDAKWPTSLTINGYNITLPTVTGGALATAPSISGTPSISCTLSSGSYHCQ